MARSNRLTAVILIRQCLDAIARETTSTMPAERMKCSLRQAMKNIGAAALCCVAHWL